MSFNYQIGQTYSFDVYPSQILGTDFKNVKVLGLLDRDSANQVIDTQAMHINIYPYLPAGTTNDPNSYVYVKIRTQSGQVTCLGLPWINEETIQLVESRVADVVVENISADDLGALRNALVSNGFGNISIKLRG